MRPSPHGLTCRLDAPAKLNLCLEVLGRGSDGFHQLRTLMATIGLRDTLEITATGQGEPIRLEVLGHPRHTAGVPTDGRNLVVRALELLRDEAGVDRGADVRLVKRIPNQAGLGGGSSDAAAALLAAARVWELDWSQERKIEIGSRLGSDVPFFVGAIGDRSWRAALATGRGERIQPTPFSAGMPVVVVKPDVGLATAAVYQACQPADYAPADDPDRTQSVAAALAVGDWRRMAAWMTNGLQHAAVRLAPWLDRVRSAFDRCGCAAHQLSGSGSAYFGLFPTMGQARRAAERLRALCVGQTLATTIG
ncbi:4-(cytidine 5'-diphospho)-2-C-methyl-D-erythritol kinase [Botrimarina mediterranea]|uniref:4-diphosphocytidyl-2-C-methyl-D-erythritol kinase n=1 Tax=Botrimarina mediterranea TaxID=2528022 RepID=A0A518K4Q1_9BACT|nr:4-(cytidine 5'-diphospho)-2-C-methyl-D-erythritol kinase [Botrimarina mediterranea]QDV72773.1 4-diphosphocytidyl-2-C-methyl-D-erythritol kinase [Botrimarina mediterranea]QDV77347.1 4-diphosphocytidyl-2-C-methyl-D-erythritol kinase [Planctomycetes bacterium K2D]